MFMSDVTETSVEGTLVMLAKPGRLPHFCIIGAFIALAEVYALPSAL